MDREKTKLNEDEESLNFKERESSEDNESIELESYSSESEYADGYEKIQEQTELYKKLNPSLDEEEDGDFYEAEMLIEDNTDVDENEEDDNEEWDVEIDSKTIAFKDGNGIQEFHALSQVGHLAPEEMEAAPRKKKKKKKKKASVKKKTKKAKKKAGGKKTKKTIKKKSAKKVGKKTKKAAKKKKKAKK